MVNVRYLTGFTGTNGACVVGRDERLFLTDFRYTEQARSQVRGYELVEAGRDMLGDLAKRLRGRSGFEDGHVTVEVHGKLAEKAGEGVELVPAGGLVEGLREVKDEQELAAMCSGGRDRRPGLEELLERGLAGRSEREVARALVRSMEDRGAEAASFPPIVASGAHGALPHAEPRDAGDPARDARGRRHGGRASTATAPTAPARSPAGRWTARRREVYELVLRAQQAALAAVRPGISCKGLDAVARAVIESAGQGERFGHGLGHGVGLEVHEAPRLGKTAEGELRVGQVVTIEPGVYVPGRGRRADRGPGGGQRRRVRGS